MTNHQARLRMDEIASVLQKQILDFDGYGQVEEIGFVETVGDGIAMIWGLDQVQSGEIIVFEEGTRGLVLNLGKDVVGAVVLGPAASVVSGMRAKRTGKFLEIPVGMELLGRVVDGLGTPIDGRGPLNASNTALVERVPPDVMSRKAVTQPLQTGIKIIDALVPIGKGQRELIIGDRQTGKTTLAIDTFLNQKRLHDTNDPERVYCVYVAIGQKQSTVAHLVKVLSDAGAMAYTIVVSAPASDPAALQFLAPYAGAALGEYFRDRGMHALVVYDDLSKHAVAYREISLLLRRPPGREAYPGDVFYLHARLLERAAKLTDAMGGGSLTALPIVETQAGDVSSYIPTNVISITDGQIFLESELFYKGIRPAMNVGISVSRIGGACQLKGMKQVAAATKIEQAQYDELHAFSRVSSDLDAETKRQLNRGARTKAALFQGVHVPVESGCQIAWLFGVLQGAFDSVPIAEMAAFEAFFLDAFPKQVPALQTHLANNGVLGDTQKAELLTFFSLLTELFVSCRP